MHLGVFDEIQVWYILIQNFFHVVTTRFNASIKVLRSDNGTEFAVSSSIYWVDLSFINNCKESQLWLVLLRYSADVASAFPTGLLHMVSKPAQ